MSACNETFFNNLKPDLISWKSANKSYFGSSVKETSISREIICKQTGEQFLNFNSLFLIHHILSTVFAIIYHLVIDQLFLLLFIQSVD
jgi:hypothetical protein